MRILVKYGNNNHNNISVAQQPITGQGRLTVRFLDMRKDSLGEWSAHRKVAKPSPSANF
jgi:hypothetical protein